MMTNMICHIFYSTVRSCCYFLIPAIDTRALVELLCDRLNPQFNFHVCMVFIRYIALRILRFMIFIIFVLWMNDFVWP